MMTIIPAGAIMKKLMIAIRSKQGGRTGRSNAAETAAAPGPRFNQYETFCCRFAAGADGGNNRFNS